MHGSCTPLRWSSPSRSLTSPATVPARSDTVLVTSMVFNDAGEQSESTDPMGTVTRQEFDHAGRVVKTIDNCHP